MALYHENAELLMMERQTEADGSNTWTQPRPIADATPLKVAEVASEERPGTGNETRISVRDKVRSRSRTVMVHHDEQWPRQVPET